MRISVGLAITLSTLAITQSAGADEEVEVVKIIGSGLAASTDSAVTNVQASVTGGFSKERYTGDFLYVYFVVNRGTQTELKLTDDFGRFILTPATLSEYGASFHYRLLPWAWQGMKWGPIVHVDLVTSRWDRMDGQIVAEQREGGVFAFDLGVIGEYTVAKDLYLLISGSYAGRALFMAGNNSGAFLETTVGNSDQYFNGADFQVVFQAGDIYGGIQATLIMDDDSVNGLTGFTVLPFLGLRGGWKVPGLVKKGQAEAAATQPASQPTNYLVQPDMGMRPSKKARDHASPAM